MAIHADTLEDTGGSMWKIIIECLYLLRELGTQAHHQSVSNRIKIPEI